ncbi:MAG: flagellar basal body P-ring protein FlgI [Gammaproteobacteria bacterium]|nr:flagellar basal body P-ring protein FlgI [Gammaproteobacteria bacterium]
MKRIAGWMVVMLLLVSESVVAERLKDIASIAGVRNNQLLGYGLVVGLDGSGDQSEFTIQSLKSMLSRLGVALPPDIDPKTKNVAAVTVTATLPPFIKPGQTLDITASSIGSAKSLRGGTLLMTPLKGIDGQIYALAQGNLVVGGLGTGGNDGSKPSLNIPSVARIPGGATVERSVPTAFASGNSLIYNLNNPDFTTAHRLVKAINGYLGEGTAKAIDASSVRVGAPKDSGQRVSFLSLLENLEVESAASAAKIVVNSRTGTVVISENVRVMPTAITHGNMTVTILEDNKDTAVLAEADIKAQQGDQRMFRFAPGVELRDIVNTVNQVGASPGDLMAILEALKEAGALRAELLVI